MDQDEAIREVVDQPAFDRDGDELGPVVDVFLDEETDAPKWVSVRAGGGDSLRLVPIGGADLGARPLRLDVERAQVESAPALGSHEQRVSPEEEEEIERHYREYGRADSGRFASTDESFTSSSGLEADRSLDADGPLASDAGLDTDRSIARSDTGLDAGRLASDAPLEVIRSEEELVIGTRAAGAERVRLIKRIVTEEVTRTVQVRHEELVIERETVEGVDSPPSIGEPGIDQAPTGVEPTAGVPATRRERLADQLKEKLPSLPAGALNRIGSGGASGAFSGETTEITLMQEEVVITKRTVPRERVRVRKEVITEQREVSGTVRREQVDVVETPAYGGDSGAFERGAREQERSALGGERLDPDRPALQ